MSELPEQFTAIFEVRKIHNAQKRPGRLVVSRDLFNRYAKEVRGQDDALLLKDRDQFLPLAFNGVPLVVEDSP